MKKKSKEVRNELIELARKNEWFSYKELSEKCELGLDMTRTVDRKKIGEILEEISKFEYANARPLLSALILRKDSNEPGGGFYKLAEELFPMKDSNQWEEEGLIYTEMNRCHEFWRDNVNYFKFKDIKRKP